MECVYISFYDHRKCDAFIFIILSRVCVGVCYTSKSRSNYYYYGIIFQRFRVVLVCAQESAVVSFARLSTGVTFI